MKPATDYDQLSEDELANTLCALQLATMKAAEYLSLISGGTDEANRHIRLALDMPPRVLRRRYDKAQRKIEANGVLSISEAAAWVACGHFTVLNVTATLERKRLGAGLQ